MLARLQVQNNDKMKGMLLAIAGPLLWGFSGIAAQYLFSNYHVSPYWLVCLRMLGAGLLLVIFGAITTKRQVFSVWQRPKTATKLIIFSLIGMMPAQLTYFMAIHYSNAATATILQFLSPVVIILFLAFQQRMLPNGANVLSVVLALIGTSLLVTGGHFNQLSIAPGGLAWGLMAAISTAIYTLYPRKLLRTFGSVAIVGWSMLLGGLVTTPLAMLHPATNLDFKAILIVGFVIVFGTLFAYLFVLQSLRFIVPTMTSLLGAFEPLTSTFLTVLFFHIAFGLPELLGTMFIIATTVIQAVFSNRSARHIWRRKQRQ